MLEFIAAVYNEEAEIDDLINHVDGYVDRINIVDDVSTDNTPFLLDEWWNKLNRANHDWDIFTWHQMETHTGLPETVKKAALQVVEDDNWVLMLDADERFAPGVLEAIQKWLRTLEAQKYSHVYFQQLEILGGQHVRTFQKSKLFRKEAITFSSGIHEDDQFTGEGTYKPEWIVYHRKSVEKQVQRESEYIDTYRKLLEEGKIDMGRYDWLRGLHYFEKGYPASDKSA